MHSQRAIAPLLALIMPIGLAATERWQSQFFYDKAKSTLVFVDMHFMSPTRGIAVGTIVEGNHHRPVAVGTADGGAHWQTSNLEDTPVSLFFLNESLGWMVTPHGLWKTTESGKDWHKVHGLPSGILRICFLDEKTGFGVGLKKQAVHTEDGGRTWKPVPEAAEPPGQAKFSAYNWIAFATPTAGLITGWNIPPRSYPQEFPDWMAPEEAISRRDTPHLSYQLVTNDGGKTWKPASASLFGEITRVRFLPNGVGLGLVEHGNGFRYPSEVHRIEWRTGKNDVIYRDRRFDVSDIWIAPDGTAFLAGALLPGELKSVIPGKVQVLKSRNADYTVWNSAEVDYRAEANRTVIAAADADHIWLATDRGMILKFVK
jgi:photosystem II stability/assembly factor-like uncharacterized protein